LGGEVIVSDLVTKRVRWMSPAMLPMGAILGVLVAALITYVSPKIYESEAVIEIRQPSGGPMVQSSVLERIKSRKTLEWVVDQLGLTNKWNLEKDGAVVVLKKIVSYEGVHGTDLVAVKVRHTDRMEVVSIAGAVVQHLKVHLEYIEREKTGKAHDALSARILDQRVDLQKQREIFANEVRKFHAGKGSREACVDAKNTWHETLEHLSTMDSERLKMELRQSIGDDPLVIHQEPEIPSSPASPNLLLNLAFGTLGGLLIGGLMGMILRPRP
jgi:uncharacterized protein involved in exopolysaccharide biosynthesis